MAFTVRPLDAATKGNWDDLHGEVKPQRLINWNIRIDTGLYARRRDIAEATDIGDDRRYGSALSTGRGMAGDLLNLNENEVLLGSRRGGNPGSWSHLTEPEAYGFQSLNGMHIPEDFTAEDMADRYPVIGICRSAYIVSPNVPEQMAHGVAAAVSGSMPLRNNSPLLRPWRPRDMLLARWPSTNPQQRAEDERRKPRAEGVDQQRLTVYVEPATYVETRLYFERDLTRSLEDENKNQFRAGTYFRRGTMPGGLSPSERAVATTRGTLQMAAFAFISMVLLNCETDAEILAAIKNPIEFSRLLNRNGTPALLPTRRDPAGVGANWRADTDARLVAWSGTLGCNLDYAQVGLAPIDDFLCDHIVGIALRPLIMNRTALYFDVTNLFSVAFASGARTADGPLGTQPIPDHPVGGIAWAQGAYAPGMLAGIKQSVERLMNRYVGHALDYTAPGSTGAIYRC